MEKKNQDKFKTPEGYFENFNDMLFARIEAEDGDPQTDFLPKSDGFGVPEGYFDSVELQILKKTVPHESKVVQLHPWRRYYFAAASIAVLLVVGTLFLKNSETEVQFDDLANTEIASYFENGDVGFSSYEIAEVMGLESFSIIDMAQEDDLSEEEIMDYLDGAIDEIDDLNFDYEDIN